MIEALLFISLYLLLPVLSVAMLVFVLAPPEVMWVAVAAALVRNISGAAMGSAFQAIMQSTVPPDLQGRVFSLIHALAMALPPLGLAAAGPIADAVGLRPVYAAAAAVSFVLVAVWSAVPSIRNLEDQAPAGSETHAGVGRFPL